MDTAKRTLNIFLGSNVMNRSFSVDLGQFLPVERLLMLAAIDSQRMANVKFGSWLAVPKSVGKTG